jgi:hypothetical protein
MILYRLKNYTVPYARKLPGSWSGDYSTISHIQTSIVVPCIVRSEAIGRNNTELQRPFWEIIRLDAHREVEILGRTR